MKVLLVLTLVGLGFASFCENESADSLREIIKPMFVAQVEDIFGHCDAFKTALRRDFKGRNKGNCNDFFDEMYCFGDKKVNEYMELEEEFDLTYSDMANFISDNGDGRRIGQASCSKGLPCLKAVVRTMQGCAKRVDNFWETAISVVEDKLSSPLVQGFIDEILESWGEDDPMTMLAQMLRERIQSWDDLKGIIDEAIDEDTQNQMIAGARITLTNFIKRAGTFCRSGCLGKSADYFSAAFAATHDEDTCPNVFAGYCGDCQNNMDSYVASADVPCCTQSVVVNIAETIIEKIDQYYELYLEKEAEVIDAISHIIDEDSLEDYEGAKQLVAYHASCIRDTYETLAEQECTMMA